MSAGVALMLGWVRNAALVVWIALPSVGHAGTDYIVIEAYDGARPKADANRYVYPVRAELEARGFTDGPEVTVEYLKRQPWRLPLGGDAGALASLVADAEAGADAFREGRFAEAVAQLSRVRATAELAPLALATDKTLRKSYRKALAALAMSHRRLGDEATAVSVMAEILRSFPDAPIAQKDFGSEAARFADQVRDSLPATGGLSIEVDEPDASIYINERRIGTGTARLDRLIAGAYRVLVQHDGVARLYVVDVTEGELDNRRILFALDSAMGMTVWAGFTFPDYVTRVNALPERVATLGAILGSRAVVVLGLEDVDGHRRLSGAVYLAGERNPRRTASLVLEPEPTATAVDDFAKDFAETARTVAMETPRRDIARHRGKRSGTRVALGVGGIVLGVGAGATSAWLFSRYGDCENAACDSKHDTLLPGFGLGLGSAALLVAATYLLTHSSHSTSVAPVAFDGGAGVIMAGTF